MKIITIITVLLFSAQAHAGIIRCTFDYKCEDTKVCEASNLKLSFTTVGKHPDIPNDPLEVPRHIKPRFVRVWGLGEEFEALPTGILSDDIIGFWGHFRLYDKTLDPGYFWGSKGEQHILTLAKNNTVRYSIHKPLKNKAFYFEGTCDRNI